MLQQLPLFYLVGGFNPSEIISQWEGLSYILWEIKFMFQTTNQLLFTSIFRLTAGNQPASRSTPQDESRNGRSFPGDCRDQSQGAPKPSVSWYWSCEKLPNTWWVTTVAPLSKCRNDPTFNFLRSSAGKVLRYGRLDFGEQVALTNRNSQPTVKNYINVHISFIYIYI